MTNWVRLGSEWSRTAVYKIVGFKGEKNNSRDTDRGGFGEEYQEDRESEYCLQICGKVAGTAGGKMTVTALVTLQVLSVIYSHSIVLYRPLLR